jgi:nucleoside-diphosphate-sugar epimerase
MTTINPQSPVLVTGGSGYIAGWIINYLLAQGSTVHATVRDPSKKKGLEHLHALSAAHPGKLKLFKADLLDQGAFDAGMQGCELVMHTASPFVITGFTDAYEALVRPAVEGTRNVLDSCNRVPSVKRVVLTSSVASIFGDNIDMQGIGGGPFTEQHWNTSSSVDHQPYSFSKVEAEKEGWKIQKTQSRWDLVSVNPSLVLGPSLTNNSASTSLETMKQMGNGTMRFGAPDYRMGIVDVRDVATAHIKAGFTPAAEGRYIINGGEPSLLEIAQHLRAHFGNAYPFPKAVTPKPLVWLAAPFVGLTRGFVQRNIGWPLRLDNSRSKSGLDMSYRALKDTVVDHFQQMLDDGVLRKRH